METCFPVLRIKIMYALCGYSAQLAMLAFQTDVKDTMTAMQIIYAMYRHFYPRCWAARSHATSAIGGFSRNTEPREVGDEIYDDSFLSEACLCDHDSHGHERLYGVQLCLGSRVKIAKMV